MKLYKKRLKLSLTFLTLAALLAANLAYPTFISRAATGDGSLSDTNIQYFGRWDKTTTTTYTGYWGGAYFKVNFTGTTVKIQLASAATFYAEIDGGTPVNYSGVSGTVNLTPTALTAGVHSLRVSNAYAATGSLPFQGLILDSGAVTQVPPVASDIIEFVGDSITAGQGTSRQALTDYAWLTGEQLHAEHTQIAYPGWCLTNCSTPYMSDQFFKLATSGSTTWDFTTYQPSVVVINLGRNDYNHAVTDATFQSVYTTFLQNIRTKYPAAQILVLRTFRGDLATPTQAAVVARNTAGDSKVHYVDTTNWLTPVTDFQPDGIHPTDCGQFKASVQLAPIVNPYLNNPADLSDIVVDNAQSGFSTQGTWNTSTSAAGYYGCNYAVDSTSGSDSNTTATWTPTIPSAGLYKIFMRWTAGSNRPSAAPIEIKYNGGIDTSKTVNEQVNTNSWVELGQYSLSASSTDNYVKINASSAGYTVADAVKFVKQPDFSDDFEDGNSTGWTIVSGSWGVIADGSEVYKQTSTGGEGLAVAGDPTWTDYSVQANIKLYDLNTLAASGIIARYTDNNNYYMLRLHQSGQLQLYRKLAGTFAQIGSANVSVATNTTYTLKLTVAGNQLTGYLNGNLLISTIDSYLPNGEIGARTYIQTASFDDFTATAL